MRLNRRHKAGIGIAATCILGLTAIAWWPSPVRSEPLPALVRGLSPTRARHLEGPDGARIDQEGFDLKLNYATALARIEADAKDLGLERLGPMSPVWIADYGGTNGFSIRLDTNPPRKLGAGPAPGNSCTIYVTRRKLTTTANQMWDLYYRAEKRLRKTVGLWP